jgi:hypothetical protein
LGKFSTKIFFELSTQAKIEFVCHSMADPILTPPTYSNVFIPYLEGKIFFLVTVLRINKLSPDLFYVIKKKSLTDQPKHLHSCRAMTKKIIFKSSLAYLVALTYNSCLSDFG